MKKTVFILTIMLYASQLYAGDTILECTCSKSVLITSKGTDGVVVDSKKEKGVKIIFAALDTDTPKMKGTLGESTLKVVKREQTILWLAEEPELGGINLWTIYFEVGMFTCSKQYSMESGKPLGVMLMGYCK